MPQTVSEQVTDEVTSANLKMLADMAQGAFGVSIQNAIANQQSVQALVNSDLAASLSMKQALQARAARFLLDTSAEEAVAFTKQLGSDIQDRITGIEAALSAGQQAEKIAITSPPQTGTGGAFGSETGLSQQIALSLANIAAGQAAILELLSKKP